MAFTFTAEEGQEIEQILARYPDRMSATLPLLHLAQRRTGWTGPEVVDEVARILELPRIHVADVVTFYTMFQRRPVGRHLISVCRTLSCHVLGGREIVDYLRRRLGLGEAAAGTDPRGLFTLEQVECLAACGTAPVLLVDGVYHENMTVEKVGALLDGLEQKAGVGGGGD
ncbi:MAG: NAD(P)H-dependent oxidoreductase subunit E [bacterium]|jgi:NADH-quinone oxidoreductase subunit E|nr:NAD(P)H-dependent oxidoreductase subunit E [bacterium]